MNVTEALPLMLKPLAAVMEFVALLVTVPEVTVVFGKSRFVASRCSMAPAGTVDLLGTISLASECRGV